MKLSQKQIEFAKLSYEDELIDEEIAKKCGIADRTAYRWKKKKPIQEFIDQLAEADMRRAKRKLERASMKAVKTLISCLTCGEPETCRKSAVDILQRIGVGADSQTSSGSSVIQVYNTFPGVLSDARSGNDSGKSVKSVKPREVKNRLDGIEI